MKLSIIIPVFNVEAYIQTCLDSVFQQDLEKEEFEIIIVNDGSTDKSMEIVLDSVSQHKDFHVIQINQENQGLSVARNHGMKVASGEYIMFIDSDDLLYKNSISHLLKMALMTEADLIIADYSQLTDGEISIINESHPTEYVITEKTGEETFLQDLSPHECYVWRTIYRRDFLIDNHISFIPGIRYEDVPFTYECYLKAKNCVKTNLLFYIYRQREVSITHSFNKRSARDFCVAIAKAWGFTTIKGLSPKVIQKIKDNVFVSFSTLLYCASHDINDSNDRIEILKYLQHIAPSLQFNHGIKQKFVTIATKLMPSTYMRLLHWLR